MLLDMSSYTHLLSFMSYVVCSCLWQVIVERLIGYLRGCSDEHVRKHIATNVAELAERYAPDTTWFIGIMAEV